MKVIVNGQESREVPQFPVLMQLVGGKNKGAVVLFLDELEGLALNPITGYIIGQHRTDLISCFNKSVWKKFEGTITLEND